MVLEIDGTIPHAFDSGFVVTAMRVTGRRDAALQSRLIGIPYNQNVCFRPQPLPRPRIAGTVPAIVSSSIDHDKYAHIDVQGRYWVKFDFDLDQHRQGYESMPVRLARVYAGDTYGHHFPLIQAQRLPLRLKAAIRKDLSLRMPCIMLQSQTPSPAATIPATSSVLRV